MQELRDLARSKHPKLQLWRTIHITLNALYKEGLVFKADDLWVLKYPQHKNETNEEKEERLKRWAEEDMRAFETNISKITLKGERAFADPPEVEPVDMPSNLDKISSDYVPSNHREKHGYDPESMKFKYRDKHEIACSILDTITKGKKNTTAIMYSSWLSHYQLKKYLIKLAANDLIKQTEVNRYEITQKGLEYIEAMKKVSQIKFD